MAILKNFVCKIPLDKVKKITKISLTKYSDH